MTPGFNKLKENLSVMCLVTILRVRLHKFLELTKAKAVIFHNF